MPRVSPGVPRLTTGRGWRAVYSSGNRRGALRTIAMAAILTTTFTAGAALAQQAEPARDPAQAESAEAARPEPLHKIRVLDNPYDIASYYRSRQGSGFFTGSSERYPIASFYRSRQSSPY